MDNRRVWEDQLGDILRTKQVDLEPPQNVQTQVVSLSERRANELRSLFTPQNILFVAASTAMGICLDQAYKAYKKK